MFLPLNLFVLQAYQAGDAKTTAIVSPAQELSQPAFFDLVEGDSLKIVPEGPAGLSFDIFIYDAHTHELVGRSDDDSTDPSFQWTAAKSGRYSVVLHNVSPVDGKGLVTVVPRGSKAIGVGDSQEACFTVDSRKSCRALVEVPYATDRELLPAYSKNGKSIQAYGPEPAAANPSGSGLSYGVARVSIPRAHQMGELEGVSILRLEPAEDPELHVVLKSVEPKTHDAFYNLVKQRTGESQGHDVLIFVHGFNVNFEEALRRTAQIKYDLGFGGVTILYSWPSHGKLVDYNKDCLNAKASIPHFGEFLNRVAGLPDVKTIHVIAHSMGNRVVMNALANRAEYPNVHVRHIALMAPDIDAVEFRQLAVSMKSAADQITLYASSIDEALVASKMLAAHPRAGQGGSNLIVMPDVLETIDASSVDTSALGLNHSYYADNGAILSDLFRLFRDDPAKERFGLIEENGPAGKYWVFAARAR